MNGKGGWQLNQEFFIQWHLTEKCNLACLHCYQGDGNYPELPGQQVIRYLSEAKSTLEEWTAEYGLNFQPALHLTGGEPLLFNGLWDVLDSSVGLGFRVTVLSNGTLIDDAIARRFAEKGVKSVQISLEGMEETHNHLRGKDSFARAIAGAGNLMKNGVDVTFNVTLSRLNVEQVGEIVSFSRNLGIPRVGFSRLVPSGRGQALSKEALAINQLRNVYRKIESLNGNGVALIINDPLKCLLNDQKDTLIPGDVPLGGCSAGVNGITVLPDGTVMPCRRMNVPIGNLVESSFRKIWVDSPVLDDLRNRNSYSGRCRQCKYWSSCRGCRAIAGAISGDEKNYLADDPHCWLNLMENQPQAPRMG